MTLYLSHPSDLVQRVMISVQGQVQDLEVSVNLKNIFFQH